MEKITLEEKCIKQHAQNVGKKQKFLSNQTHQDQSTVEIATKNTKNQEIITK